MVLLQWGFRGRGQAGEAWQGGGSGGRWGQQQTLLQIQCCAPEWQMPTWACSVLCLHCRWLHSTWGKGANLPRPHGIQQQPFPHYCSSRHCCGLGLACKWVPRHHQLHSHPYGLDCKSTFTKSRHLELNFVPTASSIHLLFCLGKLMVGFRQMPPSETTTICKQLLF